ALSRGLINRSEYRRISREAAREFNSGITAALDEMRRKGQQGTDEFRKMQRALRNVAQESRSTARSVKSDTSSIGNSIRLAVKAFLAFEAVQVLLRGVRAGIGYLRDSARAAEDVARSYLKL